MSVVNVNGVNLFRANATNGKVTNRSYTYFVYGNNAKNIVTNEYAKVQGNKIHSYSTKKQLTLVDMSDVDSIKFLMDKGNDNVKQSLKKAFRIVNNKVVRKSKLHHDLAVARLICRMGIDGYIAPRLNKHRGGTFHPEIMLCYPENKVKLLKSETPFKSLNPPSKYSFGNVNYRFNNSPRAPKRTRSPVQQNVNMYTTPSPSKRTRTNNYTTPSPVKMMSYNNNVSL
jgi:hypothetical protein